MDIIVLKRLRYEAGYIFMKHDCLDYAENYLNATI